MSDQDLTPQARAALAGRLLLDALNTLPATSAMLWMSPQEIAEREEQGRAIGERLRNLVSEPSANLQKVDRMATGQREDEA